MTRIKLVKHTFFAANRVMILLVIFAALLEQCLASNLGSKCQHDMDCTDFIKGSTCSMNGFCECAPYFVQYNVTTCLSSQLLGGDCILADQCTMKVANSSCLDGACRCVEGFLQFRKHTCLGPAHPGAVCYSHAHCQMNDKRSHCDFLIPNLFGRCQCTAPARQYGGTCIDASENVIEHEEKLSQSTISTPIITPPASVFRPIDLISHYESSTQGKPVVINEEVVLPSQVENDNLITKIPDLTVDISNEHAGGEDMSSDNEALDTLNNYIPSSSTTSPMVILQQAVTSDDYPYKIDNEEQGSDSEDEADIDELKPEVSTEEVLIQEHIVTNDVPNVEYDEIPATLNEKQQTAEEQSPEVQSVETQPIVEQLTEEKPANQQQFEEDLSEAKPMEVQVQHQVSLDSVTALKPEAEQQLDVSMEGEEESKPIKHDEKIEEMTDDTEAVQPLIEQTVNKIQTSPSIHTEEAFEKEPQDSPEELIEENEAQIETEPEPAKLGSENTQQLEENEIKNPEVEEENTVATVLLDREELLDTKLTESMGLNSENDVNIDEIMSINDVNTDKEVFDQFTNKPNVETENEVSIENKIDIQDENKISSNINQMEESHYRPSSELHNQEEPLAGDRETEAHTDMYEEMNSTEIPENKVNALPEQDKKTESGDEMIQNGEENDSVQVQEFSEIINTDKPTEFIKNQENVAEDVTDKVEQDQVEVTVKPLDFQNHEKVQELTATSQIENEYNKEQEYIENQTEQIETITDTLSINKKEESEQLSSDEKNQTADNIDKEMSQENDVKQEIADVNNVNELNEPQENINDSETNQEHITEENIIPEEEVVDIENNTDSEIIQGPISQENNIPEAEELSHIPQEIAQEAPLEENPEKGNFETAQKAEQSIDEKEPQKISNDVVQEEPLQIKNSEEMDVEHSTEKIEENTLQNSPLNEDYQNFVEDQNTETQTIKPELVPQSEVEQDSSDSVESETQSQGILKDTDLTGTNWQESEVGTELKPIEQYFPTESIEVAQLTESELTINKMSHSEMPDKNIQTEVEKETALMDTTQAESMEVPQATPETVNSVRPEVSKPDLLDVAELQTSHQVNSDEAMSHENKILESEENHLTLVQQEESDKNTAIENESSDESIQQVHDLEHVIKEVQFESNNISSSNNPLNLTDEVPSETITATKGDEILTFDESPISSEENAIGELNEKIESDGKIGSIPEQKLQEEVTKAETQNLEIEPQLQETTIGLDLEQISTHEEPVHPTLELEPIQSVLNADSDTLASHDKDNYEANKLQFGMVTNESEPTEDVPSVVESETESSPDAVEPEYSEIEKFEQFEDHHLVDKPSEVEPIVKSEVKLPEKVEEENEIGVTTIRPFEIKQESSIAHEEETDQDIKFVENHEFNENESVMNILSGLIETDDEGSGDVTQTESSVDDLKSEESINNEQTSANEPHQPSILNELLIGAQSEQVTTELPPLEGDHSVSPDELPFDLSFVTANVHDELLSDNLVIETTTAALIKGNDDETVTTQVPNVLELTTQTMVGLASRVTLMEPAAPVETTLKPFMRIEEDSITTQPSQINIDSLMNTKTELRKRVELGNGAVSLGLKCNNDKQCQLADPYTVCNEQGVCDCASKGPADVTCNAQRTGCSRGTFQCRSSGVCISWFFVCDGRPDCTDASDEECTFNARLNQTCPSESFRCEHSGRCISRAALCDGRKQCPHGEDEVNCNSLRAEGGQCPTNTFRCNSGECLPEYEYCNAIISCKDGSDEPPYLCGSRSVPDVFLRLFTIDFGDGGSSRSSNGGVNPRCPHRCSNGRCRSTAIVCSGRDGCGDGTDEETCSVCRCPVPANRAPLAEFKAKQSLLPLWK